LCEPPFSQKTQKKIQKISFDNQRITKKMKKKFKKHLEIKKKYLPLHSQSETKGLQIGDENGDEKKKKVL
jgi:hypothetical protein